MSTASDPTTATGDQFDIAEARREFFRELRRFAEDELAELKAIDRAIWQLATAAGDGAQVDTRALGHLSTSCATPSQRSTRSTPSTASTMASTRRPNGGMS